MNQILEHIDLINKQKFHIKNILKEITKKQLVHKAYNTNNDSEYNYLKSNEKIIGIMLKGCFGSTQTIRRSHGTWFITTLDDKILACLLVIFEIFGPWIWNVCRDVSPEYNGLAIGENLIKYTLDYLKMNYPNHKKIYLWASQKPTSRTNFYKSIGFKETVKKDRDTPEMVFIQSS